MYTVTYLLSPFPLFPTSIQPATTTTPSTTTVSIVFQEQKNSIAFAFNIPKVG